ncbi:hypothetical protein [Natrinema sp. H-ect4]|uniref:hypothetical protein n=1 Tax=Natrinema sp. H-ect4 TaxID=3242699 RepID=UPI0035A9A79D
MPTRPHHQHSTAITEGALVSKIETALESVLDNYGLDKQRSSVPREKYIYLVSQKFSDEDQEPITYGWFKWGASSLAGPGGERYSRTLFADFSDASELYRASRGEIEEYIENGDHNLPVSNWWDADFLDFLEHFYTHNAPPKYRDLYLSNIRFLRIIDEIDSNIHFDRRPATQQTYEEVRKVTSDLKKEVKSVGQLAENYTYLSEFTALFEDVVMMLVDIDSRSIESEYGTAISELRDLYRENVWLMIAHSMSVDSAKGPNTDKIYGASTAELTKLREEFTDNLRTKKEMCDRAGLLPSMSDFDRFEPDPPNSDFEENVDKFMEVVDGRANNQ